MYDKSRRGDRQPPRNHRVAYDNDEVSIVVYQAIAFAGYSTLTWFLAFRTNAAVQQPSLVWGRVGVEIDLYYN